MKILHKICLFALAFAMLISVTATGAYAAPAPENSLEAALLIEKSSETILYEQNIHETYENAELSRIMTLLLAADAIERSLVSENDAVTATEAVNLGSSSSVPNVKLSVGEIIYLRDLIYCVQLSSACDAANAIAVHIAGSVSAFVEMMNAKAKELGCESTRFITPNGIDADGQHTTVWDTYLIVSAAMTFPLLDSVFAETGHTVPVTNMSKKRVLTTENELLLTDSSRFSEYCTSGCFGWDQKENGVLAATFKSDGLSLFAVGTGSDRGTLFDDIKLLSEWGLGNFSWRMILDSEAVVHTCEVKLGDGINRVKLAPSSSVRMLLDNDIPDSAFKKDAVIYAERSGETVTAPVAIGDVLGEMRVTLNGKECGNVKLLSVSKVDLMRSAYLKIALKDALKRPGVIIGIILVVLMFAAYFVYAAMDIKRRKVRKSEIAQIKQKLIEERRGGVQTVSSVSVGAPFKRETVTVHEPHAHSASKAAESRTANNPSHAAGFVSSLTALAEKAVQAVKGLFKR